MKEKIVTGFIVVCCFVVVALTTLGAGFVHASDLDPNFTKTYESKKGVVTFNHTAHSTAYECAVCHDAEMTPSLIVVDKEYGHKTCKSCHKAVKVDTAPTKCNGCHIK